MDTALFIFALAVIGSGLIVAGVYVLAGVGWCLIAGGVMAICAAAFIRRGLNP